MIEDRQGYGFPPGEIYQGLISKQLDLQIDGGGGGVAGGGEFHRISHHEDSEALLKMLSTSLITSVIKCV